MLQNKYKNEIIKALQDVPEEEIPRLLEIIHFIKVGIGKHRKKTKRGKDPLLGIKEIAVETGIPDLAEHHDYYLYGVPKK